MQWLVYKHTQKQTNNTKPAVVSTQHYLIRLPWPNKYQKQPQVQTCPDWPFWEMLNTRTNTHVSGFPMQQTTSPARLKICSNVYLKAEKSFYSALFNRLCILVEVWTWIFFAILTLYIYKHHLCTLAIKNSQCKWYNLLFLWSSCVSEVVLNQAEITKAPFSSVKLTNKI